MNTEAPTETLIRRIQKLLALATSPNENEAQSAAAKAQELLAAYGLEMAEVQAHQAKTTKSAVAAAPRTREYLQGSAMYSYQQQLMRAIATNNFCYYMLTERYKDDPRAPTGRRMVKTHTLIGSHLNVTVATLLYEYLIETMDRLLPYQGMEKRGKQALLWLAGCSDRLQERLTTQRREQEAAAAQRAEQAKGDGRSLVTLTDLASTERDLNNDFIYGQAPGTTAANRAKWMAQRAAAEAARKAEWERSLATQENEPVVKVKAETDAQRRKREQKEANEERRWREKAYRRYEKISAKVNSPEYQAGSRTGNDIGLNKQVKEEG